MAANTRFYINPLTRDWVQVRGQPKQDDTVMSEAFFLLDLQRGSASAFPNWGSRLHTLGKLVPNVEDEAKSMAEEALAPMVQDGRISSLTVSVTRPTPTYLEIICSWPRPGGDPTGRDRTIIKKLLTLS